MQVLCYHGTSWQAVKFTTLGRKLTWMLFLIWAIAGFHDRLNRSCCKVIQQKDSDKSVSSDSLKQWTLSGGSRVFSKYKRQLPVYFYIFCEKWNIHLHHQQCLQTNKPPSKHLSTVSSISSNHCPPLIDVNNGRRKLVNGEHNRAVWAAASAGGGGISLQISISHLNHISLAAIGRKNGATQRRGEGGRGEGLLPPAASDDSLGERVTGKREKKKTEYTCFLFSHSPCLAPPTACLLH